MLDYGGPVSPPALLRRGLFCASDVAADSITSYVGLAYDDESNGTVTYDEVQVYFGARNHEWVIGKGLGSTAAADPAPDKAGIDTAFNPEIAYPVIFTAELVGGNWIAKLEVDHPVNGLSTVLSGVDLGIAADAPADWNAIVVGADGAGFGSGKYGRIDNIRVDSDAPEIANLNPPNNAPDAAVSDDLVITFDEDVAVGAGSIRIYDAASPATPVQTIDVAGGAVGISGAQATINPPGDLAVDTQYYVQIDSGAFADLVGNDFGGISDSSAWTFTTVADVSPLETGLVSHWTFDNTLADAHTSDTGGAQDGTYVGDNSLQYTAGPIGASVLLDGNSEHIQVNQESAYDFGAMGNGMSISTWFQVDNFDTSWQALVAKGEGSEFRLHRDGNSNNLQWNAGSGGDLVANFNVNDGQIHHVVVTHDGAASGARTEVWIDGVLRAVGSKGQIADNNESLMIGENPDAQNREWEGLVDDVGIWGRPLTGPEIAAESPCSGSSRWNSVSKQPIPAGGPSTRGARMT